jgi:hypothetical protein
MTSTAGRKKQSALEGFTAALALSVFVGAILVATVLVLSTVYLVITQPWSPWTWTLTVLTVSSSGNSSSNGNSSSSSHCSGCSGSYKWRTSAAWLPYILLHASLPRVQATLSFVPLWEKNGPFGDEFMRYICSHAPSYFPITIVCDGNTTFSQDQTYVVGTLLHQGTAGRFSSSNSSNSSCATLPAGARMQNAGNAANVRYLMLGLHTHGSTAFA